MDVRRRFPAQPPEPLVTIPGVPAIVMHKVWRRGGGWGVGEVWGGVMNHCNNIPWVPAIVTHKVGGGGDLWGGTRNRCN